MRLSFRIEDVKRLVADMKSSGEFIPTLNDLFDVKATFLKKGVKKKTEAELPYLKDEIDYTKVEPAFHLVKDDGIYLLSNAKNEVNDKPACETKLIAYAKGFNPDVDEDWYDRSYSVSRDDIVLSIPLGWFEYLLEVKPNAKVFAINFGANKISLAN
jgi:hypothetical protein